MGVGVSPLSSTVGANTEVVLVRLMGVVGVMAVRVDIGGIDDGGVQAMVCLRAAAYVVAVVLVGMKDC